MASSPKDPVVKKDNNQSKIGYGEEGSAIKNKTPTIVKVNNLARETHSFLFFFRKSFCYYFSMRKGAKKDTLL